VSARGKARKRALDLMYASEMRQRSLLEALTEMADDTSVQLNDYTSQLVQGVIGHQPGLDEVIATYAEGWTLDRMPAVDRNVLRIGAYEVLYVDDVPDAVAVSEALNLVRQLSTDDSPAFVNGVLGNIVRDKARLTG
jgi:transcription antitermination protein NusB